MRAIVRLVILLGGLHTTSVFAAAWDGVGDANSVRWAAAHHYRIPDSVDAHDARDDDGDMDDDDIDDDTDLGYGDRDDDG